METKVSIEDSGEATRSIRVEIPSNEYEVRFDRALTKAMPQVRINGFRPGKAPKQVVAKMYGERLHHDVLSELVGEAYQSAVQEKELRVVGNPRVKIDDYVAGADVCFTADVDIFPEPEVKDYFGVKFEVEVEKEEVSEKDVEESLGHLQERFAEFVDVEGRNKVEEGDIVTINSSAEVGGEQVEGLNQNGAMLEVGKSVRFEDFDKAVVGLEVGVESEVELTLPEDLGDEALNGKVAKYKIEVLKIQERKLPELDDELAKKSGQAETLEELRKEIQENRVKYVKDANEQARQTKLFEALSETNTFDVPQFLVDEEVREVLFEMGMLDRNKRESYQFDVSRYREHFSESAEARVRRYVMLEQIIKQESYEVQDDDLDAWLDNRAKDAQVSREEVEKIFDVEKNKEVLQKMVAREKMTEILLEKAKIKEIEKKAEKSAE